ncbi:MAG: hypothetical protein JSU63_04220, partial [Phycisphaerales bacterium]
RRSRDQESKVGSADLKSKETRFEEKLSLDFEGFVDHPNFLEFGLAGLFGLLQYDFEDTYSGRRRTSGDSGTILEFDFDGHFLKSQNYPGTVMARRFRTIEPRPFLSSLEVTTTNYGVTWQYVSDRIPTSFQFSHTDVRLDPLNDTEENGRQQNTLLRFETAYRFTDANVLSLAYERQTVTQSPYNLDYDFDDITLSHQLNFGSRKQFRLDSELDYYDQRGSFQVRRLRWRELMKVQHTETLRSRYRFEMIDRKQGNLSGVPPIDDTSYLVSATLDHKLYESLFTQLHGYVGSQDFDSGATIDRFGVEAGFDYRRTNPWGVLLGHYRIRYQEEDRQGIDVQTEVVDETHTFRDPEPVRLTNVGISTGSIFITADDRITVYQLGRDYNMLRLGDTIEIERIPTGRILNEQTVLIDYTYNLAGDFTRDTLSQDLGLRHDFAFGLSPYYQLRRQDQTVSPESEDEQGAFAEDITAHIFGTEFRRGALRLTAEYEDHDSTITPFEAIRLGADYAHRFKFGATATLKGRWTDIEYRERLAREITLLTVEGRYRHPVSQYLTLEAAVLYRSEDDSLSGDDDGVDVDVALQWIRRETEIRVDYEFGRIEDDFAKNENSALFVRVRRRF